MAGILLNAKAAMKYGIDVTAIEAALGRRVHVWRETTSARDFNGEIPPFLLPHLLESPARKTDPIVISGFSIYVDVDEPESPEDEEP